MRTKRKVTKRIAAWLMCLAMVLTTVNLPAFTTEVKAENVNLSEVDSFTAQDGDTLSGTTSGTVTIADGATITLSGATINGGIICDGSATINLEGSNNVQGYTNDNDSIYKAGIQVGDSGTTLTIRGDGSLIASGSRQSAGIGLSRAWNVDDIGGDIVIEGGNITAIGHSTWGSGIGTGVAYNATARLGNITIKGGVVKTIGGKDAAGIGTGYTYSGCTNEIGTVTIYDGVNMVDASSIKSSENIVYMHDGDNVTDSKTDYFTIIEDDDHRIITPKDDSDYTITIADDTEHGTIAYSATTAKYGDKVTITATPDFGYRLIRLVVKDALNNDVASTGNSFIMPHSNVTVSAVFERGTHGTTEFACCYYRSGGYVREASIYDGLTTVELQQGQSYYILKYDNEYSYRKFLLDNSTYVATIPYFGGTGAFHEKGNGTTFNFDAESGFYDITMTDVGNGKWSVSILKTVPQMDVIPDQTYTGSEIKPEPLVLVGSLNLTEGTDYEYSYTNNVNVGSSATVTVTFKGDYAEFETVSKSFNIVCDHSLNESVGVDNGDGTHDITCSVCKEKFVVKENHNFSKNGTCACGLTQVKYEIISEEEKTVRITGPNEDIEQKGDLIIPSTIKKDGVDYTVTEIVPNAFFCCEFTGDLLIGNNVETIGNHAFCFSDFTGKLTLGNNVTTIGDSAFYSCKFTGNLVIPNKVTTIEKQVFVYGEFEGNVIIPDSVTAIGNDIFSYCDKITSISIPCSGFSSIYWGEQESKVVQRNHDFSEQTCTPDEEGKHVQICKYCTATKISDCTAGETVEENRVEPGCATKGSYDQVTYCVDCEQELTRVTKEISVTGNHDFSKQPYQVDEDGKHYQKCKDCGAESTHEVHTGGTATCTAKAKCTKCKAEYGSLKAHTTTNVTTQATLSVAGKVEAKCSACGKITKTVSTIAIPKTFTLAKTSYEYTGSQIKPTITIKDSNGTTISSTYYTLTYGTNKAVGKGTVKVEFKNKYKGTKTLEFKIVPKTTTIGTPAIASDGITVKWTKNTSCAGYYIYRSVNGASYTKVKTIESNATVSWKDTTAKTNGNKYQYKIIAYKTVSGTTYTSAASAIKTIYFLTRPTVTLANQASAIKVSWGKNAKATGYYVYKSTDGGKTYKKVKTVTSNATVSYTDTAAKTNGTKYMYKVEAYKTVGSTTYKSVASAVKTYYFISKPSISSLTNSAAGKILVKWARNAKATGYQIQYGASSDFSGAKTVTATGTTSTLSKTIGSLTKGKTYYVRIRSYKTVGTTKYYSTWSATKSIKIVK